MTGTKQPFTWGMDQQEAFDKLKEIIMEDVVLAFPDNSKPFELTTDASDYAIGAVLSQKDEISGIERPIYFLSKSLDDCQRKYTVTEKELYAIIYALEKFRPYIYGRQFTIHTDHRALLWLCGKKDVTGRLARWSLKISEYAQSVRFIQGRHNKVADALSRAPFQREKEGINSEMEEVYGNGSLSQQAKDKIYQAAGMVNLVITRSQAQRSREAGERRLETLLTETVTLLPKEEYEEEESLDPVQVGLTPILTPAIWAREELPSQENGVVKNSEGCWISQQVKQGALVTRYWVPEAFRRDVLRAYHWNPTSAHPSGEKMYANIKSQLWWRGYKKEILDYAALCPRCQLNRPGNAPKIPLQERRNTTCPNQRISLDIFSLQGVRAPGSPHVLVILDEFTRYATVVPISDQTAEVVADAFYKNFILRYGPPEEVITDRGSNFLSRIFIRLCEALQIRKLNTTAYHPQANGANERMHGTLYTILRSLTDKDGRDWKKLLPLALYVYNNTVHKSLGMSPHQALYGYAPRHVSFEYYRPDEEGDADHRIMKLRETHAWLEQRMADVQADRNLLENKHRKLRSFEPGDLVKFTKHVRNKLEPCWVGPAEVIKRISTVDYLLALPENSSVHPVIHVSYLRPWKSKENDHQEA
jgi:transposase InsO family protein